MAGGSETPPPHSPRRLIGELFVSAGSDAGLMIALAESSVLGRDDEADVTLKDPSGKLSRRHARIRLSDGHPVLEDLDSTNGTFLNGERISDTKPLNAGDRIQIGESTLEFIPVPEAAPTATVQVTKARAIPDDIQVTKARDIPDDIQVTKARDIPDDIQVTKARDIPDDIQVTKARDIPDDIEVTKARDIPHEIQVTRARRIPAGLTRRREAKPPPAPPEPPLEPPPTFAPAGADGLLTIISGPGAGTAAPVHGGSATIGREPECDLQVLDSEVSRRHAKVTIRDGVATIDDLGSSNGTYVNGERILEPRTLGPGDRIEIGEATIVLTSPVFEGTAVRPRPAELTGVRQVITQAPELLTGEGTRKWWTLGVVLTTTFMLLLDVTIVGVAIPSISKALKPSFSSLQWVIDGYTITLTTALLTAGSLADIFGRKRILTVGLIIFTVASVLCAVSPNVTFLDFARGLQGVGGATMFACSLALIVQEFPANERVIAFGAYGAVNGVSVALGPVVGGLMIQSFGWESIFYLNVPIGIAAFFVLQRKVVNLPGPETKVDFPGLATFSGFMFLAVFATIRGSDDGWTSATILGCYTASVVFLIAFIVIELRRRFPMFDLRLFKNPTFVGSSVAAFTICFSCLALIFFLTSWFQSILGYSAIGTGARLLVFSGAALAFGPIAGKMTETVSPRIVLAVSLGCVSVGAFYMTRVGPTDSWTAILPGLILAGAGLGLVGPTLASTAVGVVPPWRGGMASGMNSTMREAGTTAGIALLGVLLQHQVNMDVHRAVSGSFLSGTEKVIANAITSGGTPTLLQQLPAATRPGLDHIARVAYTTGLSHIFLAAGIVSAIGCVSVIALVRKHHMREDAAGGH